ncbi:MAG: family 10 glycosylhydrolase [Clostridiales bacterium]|nr:family 10 glycosylhydrolase [Clostridiales bacterium]
MRRTIVSLILLISTIFWTGCSEISHSSLDVVEELESEVKLHGNSLIPNEFLQEDTYKPLNYSTQQAMWFTYMDYENILLDKTEDEFTKNIIERFVKAKSLGINTIYIQVRAFCDAYYNSELFPRGEYFSPTSDFDPLTIMINSAHSLNLSIHAWVNPMRAKTDIEMQAMPNGFLPKQWYDDEIRKGTYIVQVEDRWFLNPAYSEVKTFITDGIKEIVLNYEVDGIHIDDYFYPTTDSSFDMASFTESEISDLAAWRMGNINIMVGGIYSTIKSINKNILFGISPQGSIEKNYSSQYADVAKWCKEEGYCDYIVPQIYFGFNNETCPFEQIVYEWQQLTSGSKVKLIIGVCTYKIGREDPWAGVGKDEWIADLNVASREIEYIMNNQTLNGMAIFSYSSTFEPSGDEVIINAVADECDNIRGILVRD